MPPSARLPLLREIANLCRRLVRARLILRPLLTRTSVDKQYRPVPPGIGVSQRFNLLHLGELQRSGSPDENEDATIDETATRAEESLQEGLRLNLDYMETVSRNISRRLEVIKQVNSLVCDGHDLERWERSLKEEVNTLKLALVEKISTGVAIRAHVHFLRFCAWLKCQEETGSVEELLFWEKCLLKVHISVKSEVEKALKAVADVESRLPFDRPFPPGYDPSSLVMF